MSFVFMTCTTSSLHCVSRSPRRVFQSLLARNRSPVSVRTQCDISNGQCTSPKYITAIVITQGVFVNCSIFGASDEETVLFHVSVHWKWLCCILRSPTPAAIDRLFSWQSSILEGSSSEPVVKTRQKLSTPAVTSFLPFGVYARNVGPGASSQGISL